MIENQYCRIKNDFLPLGHLEQDVYFDDIVDENLFEDLLDNEEGIGQQEQDEHRVEDFVDHDPTDPQVEILHTECVTDLN